MMCTSFSKLLPRLLSQNISRSFVTSLIAFTAAACASMPPNDRATNTTAYTDTDTTLIGAAVVNATAQNNNQTGVVLLDTPLDAFGARVILARAAQRSLDVQYYLFHQDLSGRLLLDQLLRAADRGVRVRLLVDDMDMADRELGVAILDAHPNMSVRLFNPFSRETSRLGQYISRFGSVTRRMHNKSFTADNQMTIIGGRNVGDEYFGADPAVAFTDLDVLLAGAAAKEVSTSFDLYWNSELSYPVSSFGIETPSKSHVDEARHTLNLWVDQQQDSKYIQSLKNSTLAQTIKSQSVNYQWADVKIIYDQPGKISADRNQTDLNMSQYLTPYFEQAEREILIVSPYFVPGKAGTKMLCDIHERGVRVKILTNSLSSTDVAVVHAGYLRYRKKLLQCGIELYEANSKTAARANYGSDNADNSDQRAHNIGLSRSSLHAKMFVFDEQHTFVGSLNLDPRSIVENTEIGAVIDSAAIGQAIAEELSSTLPKMAFTLMLDAKGDVRWQGFDGDQTVSYTKEPHTSFWSRLITNIMMLLPIESQI